MQKKIIVNSSSIETRVALVEGNALAELHLESGDERSIVGRVYKGRVVRVLPGMQAAFVDIGLDKAAFMHVSDVWHAPTSDGTAEASPGEGTEPDLREELDLDPSLGAYVDELDAEDPTEQGPSPDLESFPAPLPMSEPEGESPPSSSAPEPSVRSPEESPADHEDAASTLAPVVTLLPPIEELLSKGQEILVQVAKEPIGSKGARITSHISLPGRFIVYMPTTNHIGVSRRIEAEEERRRLRDIVVASRPSTSGGYIVRTACEGVSKREIVADMRFLDRLWQSIRKKGASSPAPTLLHEDLDLILRSVRDLFTGDVAKVVVDRRSDYERIREFVDAVLQSKLNSRVELYEDHEPIFDQFALEAQVQRALDRRVWLKSGGYLIFDQTEALTTIDVNTGRFVGKKTHEETVLKTNLEAARVAVDQLRLRNIGGIIIIDFIDMEKAANRKKVSDALAEAVKRDKARTNILRISELGLVQMTRKRTRDNLRQLITTPCPTCAGDGRLRSIESLVAQVLRDVRRRVAAAGVAEAVTIRVPSEVGEAMLNVHGAATAELTSSLSVPLEIRVDPTLPRGNWQIDIVSLISTQASSAGATPIAEEPEPSANRS